MGCGFWRAAGVAVIWSALAFTAFAQTPQPDSRFDITGYAVEGSPRLKAEDFSRVVTPFTGRQKSAVDVQNARQALQQAYFDFGHCSVQVTVPKAIPDAGVITFRLVQAPMPLSKDCMPVVVLDEARAAPPISVQPGEVAIRPLADVSANLPETTAPTAGVPQIARAPLKPLQDGPMIKPLQDPPAAAAPAPKPAISAAPLPGSEPAANVTVKPLAEVPTPQLGLVAATDISSPPLAAKTAAPAPVAAAPSAPSLTLKPAIALTPAPTLKPVTEIPPTVVAVAPQILQPPKPAAEFAPAPKVEAAPAPAVVASEAVKPVVVESEPAPVVAPIAVVPSPAPKAEVPTVAVALPTAVTELKPAETPVAPAIAARSRPVEQEVVPVAPVAAALPPAPRVESAPVPRPGASEPAKPAVARPEPAPIVAPVAAASPPAPKAEVSPAPVEITPPAAVAELKPADVPPKPLVDDPAAAPEILAPVAQAEQPKSAPVVEMPKVVAVEEKSAQASKPAAELDKQETIAKPDPAPPIKVEPPSGAEAKALVAEKPIEKPAPRVVAAAPISPEPIKPEPKSVPVVPAPEPVPEIKAPVAEKPIEKPVPTAVAAAPVTPEPIKSEPRPVPEPALAPAAVPPAPAIAAKPKTEPPVAIATAPPSVSKSEVKPADKSGPPPAPVSPAEVTVRPFTDAAAVAPEPPAPPETKPDVARAPVRPLQDRPLSQTPPAEKSPVASAVATKPEGAVAAKPAAAKPEPAPTPRIAQAAQSQGAPAEQKPRPKPAPVVVRAPAGSPQSATPGAPAQTAAPDGSPTVAAPLKFAIDRFLVEGNTVLKPEAINRVLVGFTGPQKDFGDVQRALEALQTAFQDAGYGAVQVTLPEQELDDGEVELTVIETRLGKIDVQGNDYHDEKNIRNSLPEFKEGATPNSLAIARSLRIANENSSKQTQVALRAGSQDGEVDATIKVVDDSPIKRSITADNTGTYASGKYRVGFGYQHANMFNRDHTLTLQYITSPEHPSAVTVLGLGYRVPLYKLGHSIDLIAGYSDVQSGTVQQLFNVSGAGTIFGMRYNQTLDRSENYEHKISYGIDYRAFKNNVTFTGSTQQLVPDITVHPVSITYSGLRRAADSQFDFYASYAQNIFPGGNDGANSDFQGPTAGFASGARAGAKASYNVMRAGANYTRQIWGEWQARLVFAAQHTEAALIAGEQFGVGGADSVRGFDERAFSNDRGYRGTVELYTPDMAANFGWAGGRVKFLVFYDAANLTRNFPQPGEQDGLSIESHGIGLRLQTKNYLSLRADYATVVHDGGMTAGMLNGRRSSNTLHASVVLVF